MSEAPKIIDLPKVLEPHLNGAQLVSYTSRYLTKPGENYGSIMLSLTANVKRPNGEIEEMPLVAKLPPITNDFYWQIFTPERTCITENAMYMYVAPALRTLQLAAGIAKDDENELFDGFPLYYGSRISLNADAVRVDRDAILIQENLQTSGFKAGDRHKMFDFAHTKLVLETMAKYHALPIALRLKNAAAFDKYVRPYFHRFNMNTALGPEMKVQLQNESLQEVQIATNNNEQAVKRVRELFDLYDAFLALPYDAVDGPFTTIAHYDMWINNLMVQYDENGQPHKVKIVDFQIAQYESLAHDIFFFLFTSVDTEILEKHFDAFLKIYYESFIDCLKRINIPTNEYSYEAFYNEVRRVAPIELPHAIIMTKIILADNSTMPDDFKDMNLSVISKSLGFPEISKKISDIITLAEKFKFF